MNNGNKLIEVFRGQNIYTAKAFIQMKYLKTMLTCVVLVVENQPIGYVYKPSAHNFNKAIILGMRYGQCCFSQANKCAC